MADPPGVVEFCRSIRPRLLGTLTLLVRDRELAEELTQETLARAWVNWNQLERSDPAGAEAWAYRVAINLATSWLRRAVAERRARARLARSVVQAHDPDLAQRYALRQAVATLPRRQRTALVLRYCTDLPVERVAALMGCSPGTVKSLTHLAVEALRGPIGQQRAQEVRDGT